MAIVDPLACLSDASGQSVDDSDQARIHMSHMGTAASGLQGHGPADAPGQVSVTDHLDLMPDDAWRWWACGLGQGNVAR